MSLLNFPIPAGFVESISSYWFLERNVFRFDSTKLTPTLEEWARISGMDMYGSCAWFATRDIGALLTSEL